MVEIESSIDRNPSIRAEIVSTIRPKIVKRMRLYVLFNATARNDLKAEILEQ
jgi:hypothetical protein